MDVSNRRVVQISFKLECSIRDTPRWGVAIRSWAMVLSKDNQQGKLLYKSGEAEDMEPSGVGNCTIDLTFEDLRSSVNRMLAQP